MPVYDFKCECGLTARITISVHDDKFSAVCKCGEKMKKVITAPGVSFKGSGFYSNDKAK